MSEVTSGTDSAEGVAASLAAAARGDEPIWLPSAGPPACRRAWLRLASDAGITPANYGTARVRAVTASAPRIVCASIASQSNFQCDAPIIVEDLEEAVGSRYVELGLRPADAAYAGSATVVRRLTDALNRLATVPSLAAAVRRALRVVHVTVPDGAEYDVSYSDPDVPFSLWVGIAEAHGPNSELRLVEGLLHESMHLQLSLIEACVRLVQPGGGMLPSPWREEPRPIAGVLHGAYVFATVRSFMMAILERFPIVRNRSWIPESALV